MTLGFFIWARSTGLGLAQSSRLATRKNFDGLVTEISVFATEISVSGMKIFPCEHSSPGNRDERLLDKITSLSQHCAQNGIFLVLYVLHFRSMWISFISKVTRVHKATTAANDSSLCSLISSRSTGLKFPIWTDNKIRPRNRASPVTGLIWRGPRSKSLRRNDRERRAQNQSYAEEKDQVERPRSWLPAMIMLQEITVFFPV